MDMCKIPDGLYELCADISIEVIRLQPNDILHFVANYLDMLIITRENTKVAVKIVQDIMLNSEQIINVLSNSGLELKEIAAAAPRLQEAFRICVMTVDASRKACGCEDDNEEDNKSKLIIGQILKENGISSKKAKTAAKKIQDMFRRQYEQLLLVEQRDEIQWNRANIKTRQMLLKMGIEETEANHATSIIQVAYRNYYLKKNKILASDHFNGSKQDTTTWLEMMFENTGLTIDRANQAANIIQKMYRRYRRKNNDQMEKYFSPSSNKGEQEVVTIKEKNIYNSSIEEINQSDEQFEEQNLKYETINITENKVEPKVNNEGNDVRNISNEQIKEIIELENVNERKNKSNEQIKEIMESEKVNERGEMKTEADIKDKKQSQLNVENEQKDAKNESTENNDKALQMEINVKEDITKSESAENIDEQIK